MLAPEQNRQYATIERAIEYIRANTRSQPSLATIADAVGLSEYHLQRTFSQWAGLSPKRFLQYLTKEHAKRALRESADVLAATLETGLSSPGRMHDLMISCEAMTPGEFKQQGAGVNLSYGVANTPFGQALLGWTPRGICNLLFCDHNCEDQQRQFRQEWLAANPIRDDQGAARLCARIFDPVPQSGKLHLLLRGTNFQIKVWEALLNIGSARLVSYSALAGMTGTPKAQRAVGSALTANRIGFLIPCHRVIRGSGEVGHYRWGSERKLAMQAWEAGRSSPDDGGSTPDRR